MSLFSPAVKETIMRRTRKNGCFAEGADGDAKSPDDEPTSPVSDGGPEDNADKKKSMKDKSPTMSSGQFDLIEAIE